MQKKLIAVAVAGALSAPALALAQASTLQIYGKAVFEYGYVNQGGNKPNMDQLQGPGGQSIGFKGTEALGGGLSAWYQCESSADIRGDVAAGFCTRNSALGLRGGFGSVYVGKWDTPYKRVMLRGEVGTEDTGYMGMADYVSGGSTGAGAGGVVARTLWQRRQHDNILYDTPNFSGFQGHVSFNASNATTSINTTTAAKPRVWSVAGLYANGPLNLGLAYERHVEFGTTGGDDYAWALSGSYRFAQVLVGGSYNKQDYDMGPGASVDKKAWHLGVEWFISGPHVVYGSFTQANDTGGTAGMTPGGFIPGAGANTGVEKWQIGYRHNFSKRTMAAFSYNKLNNDSAASYNLMGTVNTGNTAAQAAGKSQDAWALLLKHSF